MPAPWQMTPCPRLVHGIAQVQAEGFDTSPLDDLLAQTDSATVADNHLLARELGLEGLDLLHLLNPRRVLFDEAHEEVNTLSRERAQEIAINLNGQPGWVCFGALAEELSDEFAFERKMMCCSQPFSCELRYFDDLRPLADTQSW